MFNLRVIELKSHSYPTKRLSQTHSASYKASFYEYAENAHTCNFLKLFWHITDVHVYSALNSITFNDRNQL